MGTKNIWVYDIEQLINFHSCYFLNVKTKEEIYFIIHHSQNDIKEYREFLKTKVDGMVGFNCIKYDYHLIDEVLNGGIQNYDLLNDRLYSLSQKVIDKKFSKFWNPDIPQLDLYLMMHFDNVARSTSLKEIQFVLKMENVKDMPFSHTDEIKAGDIDDIISYNRDDVVTTYNFYNELKREIKLRKKNSKKYNVNLMNHNDPAMGTEILLHYLSETYGVSKRVIKKSNTKRETIFLDNVIINKDVDDLATNYYKNLIIDISPKGKVETNISKEVVYKQFKYSFAQGGIHGATQGAYHSDENYKIYSVDVKSYYPNIPINYGIHPEHLGYGFVKALDKIYNMRQNYPKSTHFAENYGYKMSLNGSVGKMNEISSWLYDPKAFFSITINGQLMLTQLTKQLQDEGFELVMINTDGAELIVPNSKESLFKSLCKSWEADTGFVLEYDNYSDLFIRDCNNYIGIFDDGSVKRKGAYEIDKQWHKNHSFRIVPIAVTNYFINNVPIRETIDGKEKSILINDETFDIDVFDYMGLFKAKKGFSLYHKTIDNGKVVENKLTKTLRYYVSKYNSGVYKYKHENHRKFRLESGYNVTPINKYSTDHEFKPNLYYYRNEAKKLIEPIESKENQLTLL